MWPAGFDVLQPELDGVDELGPEGGYLRRRIRTDRGPIETRLYDAPRATAAVLCVGGVGGGFDSPARDLYRRLGETLPGEGLQVLRLRFRDSTHLAEATHDVLAGVALLRAGGVTHVGLVGHSFGGAVVIAAGVASPHVATVVCLATQSHGTACVPALAPRPLLLLHGTSDAVLPFGASVTVAARAGEPKDVVLLEGAGHGLDEAAGEVFDQTRSWLLRHLAPT